MTETPGTTPAPPGTPEAKPYWVYRLAAWVAIVAGIVFIVSTIFLAGVYASGGFRGHACHHGPKHGHHDAMFHKGHHRGPGPMMEGPMMEGPEGPGPAELPPSVTKPPAPVPGR